MLAVLAVYAIFELTLLCWCARRPSRGIRVLFLLLPVHTLTMLLVYHFFAPDKTQLTLVQGWKDLVILASLAAALIGSAGKRSAGWRLIDTAVLALTCWALLSIAFHADQPAADQLLAFRTDYLLGPLYFLGRFTKTDTATRVGALRAIVMIGVAIAVVGVAEKLVNPLPLLSSLDLPGYDFFTAHIRYLSAGGLPYDYFTGSGARRVGSVFLSSSDLAEASAVVLAASAGLVLRHQDLRRLGLLGAAASLAMAFLAAGRLELVVFPVLLVCFAVGSRRIGALASAAILTVAVAGGLLALQLSAGIVSLSDASAASHLNSIDTALQAISGYPLTGLGLGHSGLAGARLGLPGGEGQLLVTTQDLGDLALVLLLGILCGGVGLCLRRLPQDCDGIVISALMMVVAVAIAFPFSEILSNLFVVSATFWMLGQVARIRPEPPATTATRSRLAVRAHA